MKIENRLPGLLRIVALEYHEIAVRDAGELSGFIAAELPVLRLALSGGLPPGYGLTRRLYRSAGMDPTRHRPSSEALWRRLRDRSDFPAVSPLVDLTNFLSLKFQVPYGLYDIDTLSGDLQVVLGGPSDRYLGIRKEELSGNGRIVLKDEVGVCGNPSADSRRTCVDGSTRRLLQVIYLHPLQPAPESLAQETLGLYTRFFTCSPAAPRIL